MPRIAIAQRDRFPDCQPVFNDENTGCTTILDNGATRHLQGVFVNVVDHADSTEHARLYATLLVDDFDRDLECTGLRIDDRAYPDDGCNNRVPWYRIDFNADRLPGIDMSVFALGYMQVRNERIETGHTE